MILHLLVGAFVVFAEILNFVNLASTCVQTCLLWASPTYFRPWPRGTGRISAYLARLITNPTLRVRSVAKDLLFTDVTERIHSEGYAPFDLSPSHRQTR